MKANRIFPIGCLVLILTGCCTTAPLFVTVPEGIFRTEGATRERMDLPLTPQSRQFLVRYLSAGGNRDNMADNTMVDPDADKHYGPLLDLLSRAENLSVSNLTKAGMFAKWFPGSPNRQVVDSRNEAPPAIQPIAFQDDRQKYWWVFYHRRQQLDQLMVIKAMPAKMER
jgi:hypothetical protein